MTIPVTPASGTSKPVSGRLPPKISGRSAVAKLPEKKPVVLPKVLLYPKFSDLQTASKIIKDRLCYIIRHYGNVGISVLILRDPKKDSVVILCGDWYGNNLDLDNKSPDRLVQASLVFLREDVALFLKTMQLIKLDQAQFFLALDENSQLVLVDIQFKFDQLCGPGMVRDIFGKIYRTQEILKIEALDDRALEFIEKGTGNYDGELIIKPSKFTTFSPTLESPIIPLYAEVRR